MLKLGWLKVASSWFQDGSRSLYVGSSWSPDAQHGPQRAPKYPMMRPKWHPRWLPHRYVLASWSFFRDLPPDLGFPMNLCFSGAWSASIFDTFWNKIRRFLGHFWHLGSCMPKEVSRYPHDCCRMAYLSLSGPNMDPSWLQVDSSWAHAGPKLVPTWLKLGPCWVQIWVPSRP